MLPWLHHVVPLFLSIWIHLSIYLSIYLKINLWSTIQSHHGCLLVTSLRSTLMWLRRMAPTPASKSPDRPLAEWIFSLTMSGRLTPSTDATTGWWFGTCQLFSPIVGICWDDDPIWQKILQRGRYTTFFCSKMDLKEIGRLLPVAIPRWF